MLKTNVLVQLIGGGRTPVSFCGGMFRALFCRADGQQSGMRSVDPGHPRGGAPLLVLVALCVFGASGSASAGAAQTARSPEPAETGAPSRLTLDSFRTADAPCYDRSAQPHTAVVDSHVHFRPFGGPAVPFEEILGYFEATGVLFANVYGIGQMLPASSSLHLLPGLPRHAGDADAEERLRERRQRRDEDAGESVPDARHDVPGPGGSRLDSRRDGTPSTPSTRGSSAGWARSTWSSRALYGNGHEPVPVATIGEWDGFMGVLRERGIPLAIHSDLGSDDEPTGYLPLMEEVLRRYPDNAIVWVHMGLSRELTTMAPHRHVALMTSMLEGHPNLMLDNRVAGDRGCLLLDAGGPGGVRAVPERVFGAGPPGHGLPGIARQGPGRLPGGVGGHRPHPSASERRRLPEHRAR